MHIAIGIGLAIVGAIIGYIALGKWLDKRAEQWRDWYDNLPPDERRKVQEELYKEHIYKG